MDKEKYNQQYGKYQGAYTEDGFWKKMSKHGKKIGLNTCYYILLLYQLFISKTVSLVDKSIIVGALGYFISPIDVIPDIIIGTGLVDDATALLLALSTLSNLITKPIKDAAKSKLREYFDFKDEELNSSYR